MGDGVMQQAFSLAEGLRDQLAGVRIDVNLGGGSFKTQMKRADKSNAEYALILGETENAEERIGLKPLRSGEDQINVAWNELAATLADRLGPAK